MHTPIASHRSEQQQNREFLPQALRVGDVNIGPTAIRATFPAYPEHCPPPNNLDNKENTPSTPVMRTCWRGELRQRQSRDATAIDDSIRHVAAQQPARIPARDTAQSIMNQIRTEVSTFSAGTSSLQCSRGTTDGVLRDHSLMRSFASLNLLHRKAEGLGPQPGGLRRRLPGIGAFFCNNSPRGRDDQAVRYFESRRSAIR
jgi:hypothetical protein